MAKVKKNIVFGHYGDKLDRIDSKDAWHPTLTLCQNPSIPIDEFHLLYQKSQKNKVAKLQKKLEGESSVRVVLHEISFDNGPWDFESVYVAIFAFIQQQPFDLKKNDYYIHITTGTEVSKACWFLLTAARSFPGKVIQTDRQSKEPRITDLDLENHAEIRKLFKEKAKESAMRVTHDTQYQKYIETKILPLVAKMSLTDQIILTGETGVGKTYLAETIFKQKFPHLGKEKFVECNCATLRGDIAMSTLFGHEKGAFTGADVEKKGLLDKANGGLLFLDEIGELGLAEQAMLLKAIDEGKFQRAGASGKTIESRFFLICGTNKDLTAEVAAQRFRHDLLARINCWTFEIPSLRNRHGDIERTFEEKLQERPKPCDVDSKAKKMYLDFAKSKEAIWKDNFRDLLKSINRMKTKAENNVITVQDVSDEIEQLKNSWKSFHGTTHTQEIISHPCYEFAKTLLPKETIAAIDDFDFIQLLYVIGVCRESQTCAEAARTLFATSKIKNPSARLANYLGKDKYRLSFDAIKSHE